MFPYVGENPVLREIIHPSFAQFRQASPILTQYGPVFVVLSSFAEPEKKGIEGGNTATSDWNHQ
jgi:hypothetical protein